jgi:hypothetical protein
MREWPCGHNTVAEHSRCAEQLPLGFVALL